MLAYRQAKRPRIFMRDGIIALLCLLALTAYLRPRLAKAVEAGRSFFLCQSTKIACRGVYSGVRRRAMARFVREATASQNLLSLQGSDLFRELQEKFGAIERVEVCKSLPAGLEVAVFGVEPLCLVEGGLVLGKDGVFYPREIFQGYALLHELKEVALENPCQGARIDHEFAAFVQELSPAVAAAYRVVYGAPSRITLTPRTPQSFASIIADQASLREPRKMEALQGVLQDMGQRGLSGARQRMRQRLAIHFDIRFDDRIIVKCIEEGRRGRVS